MWKSDNQGVKEETFIKTGRRGKHRQLRWRGLIARCDQRTRQSHVCVQINWEEQLGSQTDLTTHKASKPLTEKSVGFVVSGETPGLTGEFIRETHRVLESTQTTHWEIITRKAQFACG